MSAPPVEVSARLLTAWRGEILAGAVYRLIARRLEPRERSWWAAGLKMTLAGVIVVGALYVIGLALPS